MKRKLKKRKIRNLSPSDLKDFKKTDEILNNSSRILNSLLYKCLNNKDTLKSIRREYMMENLSDSELYDLTH